MEKILNYIGGTLRPAASDQYLDVYNPANGTVYAQLPHSDGSDVESAVRAAKKAKVTWANTRVEERSRILLRIADIIERELEPLAIAESKDNGKPVSLAKKVDIPRAASNFRFFGQAITQFSSESHRMTDGINYTLRQPIGVVGAISPWNLPLYLFTWKIAPALAVGNTVIAKPSEVTPMTAFLLSQICIEAGLPDGVLNIVHGEGPKVGKAISAHADIKAITFTGSTRVGKEIATIAAPMFKKVSLEMGGKNANVIFDDCDFDKMIDHTMRSSFANQGQICLCGSRILVQESIYEKFKEAFVSRTENLVVGPPDYPNTNIGAIVSKPHYEKILHYIQLAQEEGGTILTGGKAIYPEGFEQGWYIRPTIIEGLSMDCRTNQEEIFGPVVTIMTFKDKEEAISLANNSPYGLSTTVWTSDLNTAHHLADRINVGIVWINTWLKRDLRTPFGGMKASGVGREGGLEALRFFTEPKNICIQY